MIFYVYIIPGSQNKVHRVKHKPRTTAWTCLNLNQSSYFSCVDITLLVQICLAKTIIVKCFFSRTTQLGRRFPRLIIIRLRSKKAVFQPTQKPIDRIAIRHFKQRHALQLQKYLLRWYVEEPIKTGFEDSICLSHEDEGIVFR